MSEAPAIRVAHLSKAYALYPTPQHRLRQLLQPPAARLLRRLGLPARERRYYSEHWALRDLSFEVPRGETLAVIGRNGAGKSTLLQLLCGTLTPTAGELRVSGRVAALLELGSGFNPEYTGRENALMNAAVLGLPREEAARRLPDILAFADIGAFVDQPVKAYSSGMAMRLAFAVIAHVDADVLIVDEALAVGDAYFQQKCLRWLRDFQARGTVLFCGHDMGAVLGLCQRALWLDQGRTRRLGPAKEVVEAYLAATSAEAMGLAPPGAPDGPAPASAPAAEAPGWQPVAAGQEFGSGDARITHLRLLDAAGYSPGVWRGGEEAVLEMRIAPRREVAFPIAGLTLKDRLGQPVFGTNTGVRLHGERLAPGREALLRLGFRLPELASGRYVASVAFASGSPAQHVQHHWADDALELTVANPHHNGALVAAPALSASLGAADG